MDNKMSSLIIIILLTLIISFASMNKIDDWYLNLDKSSLTPPRYMFSIVWIILYILMSISVWIVWNKEKKITLPIILYIIQLILNFAWSPLFFKYRLINESLFLLLLIWILVFIIINLFYSINKKAGLLLMPYLIWLTFAFYLNYYIVKNN
jgi:tryptophan-rich sensory protein